MYNSSLKASHMPWKQCLHEVIACFDISNGEADNVLRRFSTPEKFNVNKKERICTAIN
jgi:hypothetical protein